MSAAVKLSSKMPGDFETNGIDQHAGTLVDRGLGTEDNTLMVAVVWLDTASVQIDADSGDHVPTIRVRRIEPLGDVDAVSATIRDLVQEAVAKRTGRTPIPFDVGEIVEGHDPDQLQIGGDEA